MPESIDTVRDPVFLKRLRIVSLIEGCSTLVLFFIAMPMKYMMDMPQAVSWPGRIHGGLFMLLVVMAFMAIERVPIGTKLSMTLVIAAVVPFGPFLLDKKLRSLQEAV
jgi:integral membrane protein